jgi:hypothetical protein
VSHLCIYLGEGVVELMRLHQEKRGPLPIYSFTQMEPQVSCTFCSAVFPERGSLDLHTMTEHGEMMQLLAEEHLGRRPLLYSSSFSHVIFLLGKSSFSYRNLYFRAPGTVYPV